MEPGADDAEYLAFAERLTAAGIVSDPWLDGRRRFRPRPIVLGRRRRDALARAAEEIAAAWDELAQVLCAAPELIDRCFRLTPFQRLMWEAEAPLWHGIARADVFVTDDGRIQICELNCDTPSGEAETVECNRIAHQDHPTLEDPNRALEPRFCALVEAAAARVLAAPDRRPGPLTVGILYPTELTEDLSMIRLYRRWLEARGARVLLGSPFNLGRVEPGAPGGRVRAALFGEPCDVFVRHYKTDWWGEREPIFDDQAGYPDAEPLAGPLRALLGAVLDGGCAVLNPFGAVVLQNKRAMACLWELIDRFSPAAQAAIRAYLPETVRLDGPGPGSESLRAALRDEKDRWVLKSDYGCEGAEVVVGPQVTDAEWAATLLHARPERWIAQRWFRVAEDEAAGGPGAQVNYGVYLVGGVASGFFSRIQRGATDGRAITAATLVDPEAS